MYAGVSSKTFSSRFAMVALGVQKKSDKGSWVNLDRVRVAVRGNRVLMEATNSYRLHRAVLDATASISEGEFDVLVSADHVRELRQVTKKSDTMTLSFDADSDQLVVTMNGYEVLRMDALSLQSNDVRWPNTSTLIPSRMDEGEMPLPNGFGLPLETTEAWAKVKRASGSRPFVPRLSYWANKNGRVVLVAREIPDFVMVTQAAVHERESIHVNGILSACEW